MRTMRVESMGVNPFRPIQRPVTQPLRSRAFHPVVVPQAMGHTAYHHVGDITSTAVNVVSVGAVGLAAFHGYKRTRSAGWAVVWALCAGLSPIITTAVVLAQGVGKRKGS